MNRNNERKIKSKARGEGNAQGPMSLLEKVAKSGGKSGFILEENKNNRRMNDTKDLYGRSTSHRNRRKRKDVEDASNVTAKKNSHRSFKTPSSKSAQHDRNQNQSVSKMVPTPSFLKMDGVTPLHQRLTLGKKLPSSATSRNATINSTARDASSIPFKTPNSTRNPYKQRRLGTKSNDGEFPRSKSELPRSSSRSQTPLSSSNNLITGSHTVCAISENLARETCISCMDASSPTVLSVTKQGNGQTYAEALSFLEYLKPDEILLNEGRRNSQLVQKIISIFQNSPENDITIDRSCSKQYTPKSNHGSCISTATSKSQRQDTKNNDTAPEYSAPSMVQTTVKFVPRIYFDQTRGAELLSCVLRPSSHDTAVVGEYILLSSSNAVIQYVQQCLGANFCRNSLELELNWGGKNRMAIDRSTLMHLELLSNAKTGKTRHSLIGTIDRTFTTVGSRLLRTNLMSPPTRKDTINARLDLVDTFLEDEEFFYEVMEQLEALPEIEKMLSHMALVPQSAAISLSGRNKSLFGNGNKRRVTTRMASRGISALVCIKSILSVVPNTARILEIQLTSLTKKHRNQTDASTDSNHNDDDMRDNQTECHNGSIEVTGSLNLKDDADELLSSPSHTPNTDVNKSDLLLGLGGQPHSSCGTPRDRFQLLRGILNAMKQPELKEILDIVLEIFTESTTYSNNTHAMRHQECFALKPNMDGMLDVLRKAFLANVDDIYRLADEYAQFGFTVAVKQQEARGYYLAVPINSLSSELPPLFIQPVKTGRFINCTTEEVHSLNARAQENVQDMLLMTHERIQKVIDIARQKYDVLASLSDAIALLDMCHCFADNVASSRLPWCRPIMSDCGEDTTMGANDQTTATDIGGSGAFAVREGRYAIDSSDSGLMVSDTNSPVEFIPNDTYASSVSNFTLITGINGSGKSTYLKQIATTVILAHCGSYVPAEEAFIPIRDCLCTRIGTSDDPEHNISTFMQEMKETAFICNNATDKSLILIDELGRATSNEDGVAIAWSIAEFLLVKRTMTFFVTHYPQLASMADIYPNVQNQHLGAVVDGEKGIRYMHKIFPGPCQFSSDYGVEMASTCGWQQNVVRMARNIRKDVESKLPNGALCQQQRSSNANMMAIRQKAETLLSNIVKHLVALKEGDGRLSDEAKRSYLQDLRNQFVSTEEKNTSVVEMMKHVLGDDTTTTIPFLPIQRHSPSVINTQQLAHNSVSNDSGLNFTKREEDCIERAGKMVHYDHSSFSSSASNNDSSSSDSSTSDSSTSESDDDTTAINTSLDEHLSPMISTTSERYGGYLSNSSSSSSSSSTSSGSL